MSIIADDIWDKFEFEDDHVDNLLASFATTHPINEELIKTKTEDWMGDQLSENLVTKSGTDDWMGDQLPVTKSKTDDWMGDQLHGDLVTKMIFTSSEQLQGYNDAHNSVCSECMWNGNCVRKNSKLAPRWPKYNSAHIKGRINSVTAVRKLNFDAYENNNRKFESPKRGAFEETTNNKKAEKLDLLSTHEINFPVHSEMNLMEHFPFGLAENDEGQVANNKRKKSSKNAQSTEAKKRKEIMEEKNNNVDLYCYEKFNEKSLLWNNDRAKILKPENISFSPVMVKKIELNNVGSPFVQQSVKDFNLNVRDDQQNKTKHEIMNCYEVLNLFDDKVKNQEIQIDTTETLNETKTVSHFNVRDKPYRNSRKEKDLRNQRDRERNLKLEQGYRELSRLLPQLSLPQSKPLTVAQKREILQKSAQYCNYLINRNLVLRKEKEYETKRNSALLDAFMFLSTGKFNG